MIVINLIYFVVVMCYVFGEMEVFVVLVLGKGYMVWEIICIGVSLGINNVCILFLVCVLYFIIDIGM